MGGRYRNIAMSPPPPALLEQQLAPAGLLGEEAEDLAHPLLVLHHQEPALQLAAGSRKDASHVIRLEHGNFHIYQYHLSVTFTDYHFDTGTVSALVPSKFELDMKKIMPRKKKETAPIVVRTWLSKNLGYRYGTYSRAQ